MRIGILTFHDSLNHGAYLQAYSSMKTIEKLGHEAVIINYTNPRHQEHPYRMLFRLRGIRSLTYRLERISRYRKFREAHRRFRLTSFTTSHEEVGKELFDVVLVGSDIVWNFKWDRLGRDPIYFGHHLNTSKLISYAPSFGAVTLDDDIPEYVRTGLKKFHAISVRDENSRVLVRKAADRDATVVLDPTFLTDWNGMEVEPVLEGYVLVYAFELTPREIDEIRRFARDRGLRTVAVVYKQKWCDLFVNAMDPFEWLGFFRKADYIATSTFHGTVFSLKYNKQFSVSMNEHIQSKTEPLLEKLDLRSRILSEGNPFDESVTAQIDYAPVNTKLAAMANSSLDFLIRAIND